MNSSLAFINVNLDPLKTHMCTHTDLALRVFHTRHYRLQTFFLLELLDWALRPTALNGADTPESSEKTGQQHITVSSVSAFSLWLSSVTRPTGKEPRRQL